MARTNVIEYGKVNLVLLEEQDIPFLLSLVNDKSFTRTLSFRFPITEEQEREWINNLYSQSSQTQLVFGVCPKQAKGFSGRGVEEIIGVVALSDIDTINAHGQTATMIAPGWQGLGYGSDAYIAILRYAFYELNLERVKAHIKSFNEGSIQLHESLGYNHRAIQPKWYKEGGVYYDDYIYVLERDDFEQLAEYNRDEG